MIDFDKISIYSQYRGTNIEELIKGELEIINATFGKALEGLLANLDLNNAEGDCLDLWGSFVGFSRYIPIPEPHQQEFFVNFSFFNTNFYRLKFFDASNVTYNTLADSEFRQIITLLLQSQNIANSIANISGLTSEVFEQDISVGDRMDMFYSIFYQRQDIPSWLDFIISRFDIFPRPAGVEQKIVDTTWRFIGFQPLNIAEDWARGVTNFTNAQFIGNRPPPRIKP